MSTEKERAYQKQYRSAHKEELSITWRKWYDKNKEARLAKQREDYHRKRRTGLTVRRFTGRYKPLTWIRCGSCIKPTSAYINQNGYPVLQRNGDKPRTIARTILLRRHGNLPSSIVSRHTCDNRWCINPDHLIIGTTQDNTRDRQERGRTNAPKGEQNGLSKLTEQDIRDIRSSTDRQTAIARKFGIDPSNVSYIRSRKTWKHVL